MAICKKQRSAAKKGDVVAAPEQPPSGDDVDIDPKLEWHDDAATGYVIRLALPGFKKEDFKAQVDAGGRLTVRGERPAGRVRFHKAFQLPPTANLDGVAGRFDGNVLSLTVPKNHYQARSTAPEPAETVVGANKTADEAECEAAAREKVVDADAASIIGKGQMVAAALAGFALGVFVAHRILSAANSY